MRRIGVFVLATVALLGTLGATASIARPTDKQAFVAAKRAVTNSLKDPDSARFSALRRATRPDEDGQPTDVVCGLVNARNSFGGYQGASPFAYVVATDTAYISEPGTSIDNDVEAVAESFKAYGFCLPSGEQKDAERAALGLGPASPSDVSAGSSQAPAAGSGVTFDQWSAQHDNTGAAPH